MQNKSKKHHYVPQSLLKFFSVDNAGKKIYVYDKSRDEVFPSSIMDAGSENGFNKLKTETGIWNFEHIFNEVDGRLAILLNQIHQVRDVSVLTKDDRRDWADMVAVQILRTPIIRTTLPQLAADLVDTLVENGLAKPEDFSLPTDNDSRHNMVKWFQDRDSLRRALEYKDFVLFEGTNAIPFLISDHPVVICQSISLYGDSGLNSLGVGVYLPLGSDIVLAMLCKSIRINLNAYPIEVLNMPQESAQMCIALREGLRTGRPVRWTDSFTAKLNAFQIARSSRFLYGSQENAFDAVQIMLKTHPELRQVKSHVQVGQIGSFSSPLSNQMTEGQWLVLFGLNNHCLLSIQNWCEEQCEGETDDLETLNRALADAPINRMEYYDADKQQGLMKRNVRIEILTNLAPVRFRIRNIDPAMDALDAAIAARQESSE